MRSLVYLSIFFPYIPYTVYCIVFLCFVFPGKTEESAKTREDRQKMERQERDEIDFLCFSSIYCTSYLHYQYNCHIGFLVPLYSSPACMICSGERGGGVSGGVRGSVHCVGWPCASQPARGI
jgi:hypothetical protein